MVQTLSNVFRCRLYRALCSDYARQLDRKILGAKLLSLFGGLSQAKNKTGLAAIEHGGYHYYDDLLVKVGAVKQALAEQRLLYFKRYQSLIVFESTLFSICAKEFLGTAARRLGFFEAWETRKLSAQLGYYFRHYCYLVGMYGEKHYEVRAAYSTEFHRYPHHDKMWQDMKEAAQHDHGVKDVIFPDYKN